MFTVLPPGAKLGRHHDPVASSLRYHLGLLTPNSEQCALTLDGVEYPWRDGEELLFDQTYLHSAVNRTDIIRVILFCDVEKTQLRGPVKRLADAVNSALVAKFTGANDQGNCRGFPWPTNRFTKFGLMKERSNREVSLLITLSSTAASYCFSTCYICYCDLSSLGVHLRRQRLELR
jgi:aspartyl/asparaginyl beta-hydroxylase (cupin superfamily)